MAGIGAHPLDIDTPIGLLRANLGDVASTPLDPPVAGKESYGWFSDQELTAFLALGRRSIARATGKAIMQLALSNGLAGRSVTTEDLSIDNQGRGATLREIAESWLKQADQEDALVRAEDSFVAVVRYPGRPRVFAPERGLDDFTEDPRFPGLGS